MAKSKYGGYSGGVSPAQSGGRDHTFGGGRGGTKQTRGSTFGRRIGTAIRNGLTVAIRSDTGNNTMRAMKGTVGHPPPVMGGPAVGKLRKRKIQKPVWGGH